MPKRPQLRSRIFALTGLFVMMLFGSTLVLTWRAQSTQRQFSRLLTSDTRAIALLDEVTRTQNGFRDRWLRAASVNPAELPHLAARYRVVTQLLEREPLRAVDYDPLRRAVSRFRADVTKVSEGWSSLGASERVSRVRALVAGSDTIDQEASRLGEARKREVSRQLPLLDRSGENMKRTGLAVAWILAVISFALARITLATVVRPLEELSRASARLAGGDLTARATVGGDVEIAQLADSFNQMAGSLAASHEALAERARTDDLTGLPNFRAFREVIDREITRAERYRHEFGVLVVDLDRFKQFNDTYGHQAGNEALRAVAAGIRASVRSVDTPARYGGEEFAVVLPEIDHAALGHAAERVRATIEAIAAVGSTRTVTASVGGALFPGDGASAEEIFAVADRRLYEAKRAGRNRSIVLGTESTVGAK